MSSQRAFFFVHIEGFPYVWFTAVPADWSEPSGITFRPGLMLLPGKSEISIDCSVERIGGIAEPSGIELQINDDDVILPLFFARAATASNHSEIAETMAAFDDDDFATKYQVTSAPTDGGTVYIDNETITYTLRSGYTFSGVTRGRYHSLWHSDLSEVVHSNEHKVDPVTEVGPILSTYPRTLLNRVATLYKGYLRQSGTAYAINDSTYGARVIYRGPITAFGDSEDHNGIAIRLESLINLLDRNCYREPAKAEISGLDIPVNKHSLTYRIQVQSQGWLIKDGEEPQMMYQYQQGGSDGIEISGLDQCSSLQDVIKKINAEFVFRGLDFYFGIKNNKVCFWSYAVGFDENYEYIPKNGTSTLWYGVIFILGINDIVKALGFEGNDYSFISPEVSWDSYKQAFALYTNPSHYASYITTDDTAQVVNIWASKDVPKATFRYDAVTRLPISVDENHTFNESPADGSKLYLKVGDKITYECQGIDSAIQKAYVQNALINYTAPIHSITKPDEDFFYLSVSDDPVYATQTIRPKMYDQTYKTTGIHVMLLRMMISTGGGSNIWDIYDASWGLGISEEFIDIDSFLKLQDKFPHAALERDYMFYDPFNFKDLLESELKLLGVICTVRSGKITLVDMNDIKSADSVAIISDSNRVIGSDRRFQSIYDGIYTDLKLEYDHDILSDEYRSTDQFRDVSIPQAESLDMQNKGIISSAFYSTDNTIYEEIYDVLSDRFRDLNIESYEYSCTITSDLSDVIVGDVVSITDQLIIDPISGTRGVTGKIGIVIAQKFDEMTGIGELTVLISGKVDESLTTLSNGNRVPNIGPFAPAVDSVGMWGGDARTIEYDDKYFNGVNAITNGFGTGSKYVLIDQLGNKKNVTVESVDTTLKTITFEEDLAYYVDLVKARLVPQSFGDVIESQKAVVAFADIGGMIGIKKGLKL